MLYFVQFHRYTDREICFCFNEDTLTLVDVTVKTAMTLIAKTGYVNAAYTHQVKQFHPHPSKTGPRQGRPGRLRLLRILFLFSKIQF